MKKTFQEFIKKLYDILSVYVFFTEIEYVSNKCVCWKAVVDISKQNQQQKKLRDFELDITFMSHAP